MSHLSLIGIYDLGKSIPLPLNVREIDKRLAFMLFPYDSRAVINTALATLVVGIAAGLLFSPFSAFLSYTLTYAGFVLAGILYLYPTSIYYHHRIGEYNEEMLRAILRLSTFISMDTSLEFAFFETAEHLHGTLKIQFQDIKHCLERRTCTTLGEALGKYVDVWNEINPVFVKSLRLLQTAALSKKQDRDEILTETSDTILLNYTTLGKRFAEQLTNNAKKLVSMGVLFPILSLMLLPLLAVFMPDLIKPPLLAFLYVVLFPTLTLLMALSFSSKRIQVDTVRIEDSADFEPMPKSFLLMAAGIGLLIAVPTILYLPRVLARTAGNTETIYALIMGWLLSAGVAVGCYVYASMYERRYRKLWNEVYEIEQDLPHLLQSYSTYLTLNISTENVIPEVIDDYERFGFANHPVVKAFKKLHHYLLTGKQDIETLVRKRLRGILPSQKVVQIITQIVSFSRISQKSSARVAKMVREQTIGIYKLDDYMKTLLAESIGLINITTSMLAPLLCAAAVIMSVAIVKALTYITDQLNAIAAAFGTQNIAGVSLVDTSRIIPPIFIEVIVGMYLIETILILSFFATTINVGNDWYKFFQTFKANIVGFIIYTFILFGGYYFVVEFMFANILQVG